MISEPGYSTPSHYLSAPSRRRFCQTLLAGSAGLAGGCGVFSGVDAGNDFGRLDKVWGRQGFIPGRFAKPRAMTIDADDNLYIVDKLARIQAFDLDGKLLREPWRTPEWENGKPTGMSVVGDRLLVADTHYYRVLSYTLDGKLKEAETVGGTNGKGPAEFGWVTDAVRDSSGCLYIAQYGDNDRIQKFSPEGDYLLEWGSHGDAPGRFRRPQCVIIDPQDRLWVCDACNHRLQVFDGSGDLLFMWGDEGADRGQLYYPYGAVMDSAGDLYVVEYGNNRIQKFNQKGESLGTWGSQGREPGQLWNPWSAVLDSQGRLHVLDSNNHRVQRVVV